MKILIESAKTQIEIKRSVFIAELNAVHSQCQVREFLKSQKTKYFDAKHVVHAFVIGSAGEILGCSDDGEPGGTAGFPVLNVLKGAKITNCILTVTRYFGGILLGTGGLAKAYGNAAKEVVSVAKTEQLIEKRPFNLSVDYAFYDTLCRILKNCQACEIKEDFGSQIKISGSLPTEIFDSFCEKICTASFGKYKVK
ncbi:MAG: IMPACT family protein [Treponemataceae bacterium]